MGGFDIYILHSNILGRVSGRSVLGVSAMAGYTIVMQVGLYIHKVLASYIVSMVGG